MPQEIRFFRFYEANGFLSNFYPSPIILDGKTWPTVEHYFQAMKFPAYPDYQERIRQAHSPEDAKRFGGRRSEVPIRTDWETFRGYVMRTALRAKFTQHPHLHMALLVTDDAVLIEANYSDPDWGVGPDGKGKNLLGKLLMELRVSLSSGERV